MIPNLILAISGVGGALLFAGFAWFAARDRHATIVRSRVRRLSRCGAPGESTPAAADGGSVFGASLVATPLRQLLPGTEEELGRYELRFKQAGLSHPAALTRFFAARLCGLIVPFAAILGYGLSGHIKTNFALMYAVCCGCIGWLAPSMWLDRRIARRQLSLRRALPDFMDLLIVCLEGGLSIPAALQRVAGEIAIAHPALAHELDVVQRDTTLGASIDAAFQRFAERSGLEAVRVLTSYVREARRFGSEIITALRAHADTMRFQREQAAEENAQKASVKILFPMLLLILPAVFVVLAGPAIIQIQQAFSRR